MEMRKRSFFSAACQLSRRYNGAGKIWFRDLDSNQDSQLQRLMCYRLHYPGTAANSLAEEKVMCEVAEMCANREFLLN
jgi:hypothetical protein